MYFSSASAAVPQYKIKGDNVSWFVDFNIPLTAQGHLSGRITHSEFFHTSSKHVTEITTEKLNHRFGHNTVNTKEKKNAKNENLKNKNNKNNIAAKIKYDDCFGFSPEITALFFKLKS